MSSKAQTKHGAVVQRKSARNERRSSPSASIARMEGITLPSVTHVKDLIPDLQNRRRHNSRNLGMLSDALGKVGAARSIVIDEHDEILAGNGVVEAAAEAGITKVQVVEADGSTIIAVRRRGLTPDQKRQLAIYDNRVGELAEWDTEQLQADVAADLSLEPWFSKKELAAVLEISRNGQESSDPQLGGLEYRVVVECRDEGQQADLLRRFEEEGLACRALIS